MFPILRFLTLVVLLSLPISVRAQDGAVASAVTAPETASATEVRADGSPDYTAWSKLADRVESALEVGRASDTVMLDLRGEIAEWRELFSAAQAENAIRINTLKTQISTLGPAPEAGGTEPAILTQRRDELTEQLNEARVPVQKAEEAYTRADVLIREIDSLMRSRQTDLLLELGPTPINPASWPKAVDDYLSTLRLAWAEMTSAWGTETQWAELKRVLPVTIILGVIGLTLVLRGRSWVMRFGAGLRSRSRGAARGVWGFLTSLGQVVAPMLGIYLLVQGLNTAGVLGLRGQILSDNLLLMGLFYFGALWLGTRVFGIGDGALAAMRLPTPAARAEGRYATAAIGLLYGLSYGLERIGGYEDYSGASMAVLNFPLMLGAGFLMIRLGRLMRQHADLEGDATSGDSFRTGIEKLLSRAIVIVGYLGPLAAAIGYAELAGTLLFPTALTLALIALLEVLQQFYTNLYGLVTGRDDDAANQALSPTLATFATALAMMPVAALIWGARWTDLTELWTTVGQGFQLGDTQVTPRTFLVFVVVFLVGYVLTRLLQGALKSSILPRTSLDKGGQNAISSGLGYVGIFVAALVAITAAGIDMSSLAIVAGALSVGIGFGLQNIVSNFVSGIILLIERPISEGDWIEVGGQMGYVRDISVRSTRIETFDRSDVILPNSDLISGVVTNFTRGNSIGRVIVPVGVAYGNDTKRIEKILLEVAEAHPMVTVNPAPYVVFQGFGADALEFEIRAILRDVNYVLSVRSDMNHEIARRFGEEGVEVPFAQRDIWLRNPEALTGGGQAAAPTAKSAKAPIVPSTPSHAALDVDDMHMDQTEDTEGDGDE